MYEVIRYSLTNSNLSICAEKGLVGFSVDVENRTALQTSNSIETVEKEHQRDTFINHNYYGSVANA